MNELDRIKNNVNKLAKSIYELKMLGIYKLDELDTLENNGLKEICDRNKHMIEDYVYTMHKEATEALV